MIIDNSKVLIKGISLEDIEDLRVWKNKYRNFFFHKEKISSDQQLEWYNKSYLNNNETKIFKISYDQESVGCIGVYFRNDHIEIYNVILGNDNYKSSGLMTLLFEYIYEKYQSTIFVKVLNINPALGWYRKNGFFDVKINDEFTLLKLEI
jgi:carboxypeptidase C (cathepsin A)